MPRKEPAGSSSDKPARQVRRRKTRSPLDPKTWGHDPLLGLESIKTTMSGMLNELFARRANPELPWEPPIDLYEDDGSLVVLMSLPGLHKDEVQMHAYASLLLISGHTSVPEGVDPSRFHFHERRVGPFHRSIPLPYPITPERIRATLRDGVLKVTMPRAGVEPSQSVQVEID